MREEKMFCFSACANVWNSKRTDILAGGQMLDQLGEFLSDDKYKTILDMWNKYHLNDLKEGCKAQDDFVGKLDVKGDYYDTVCSELNKAGLLVVDGYKFGSKWLTMPIPETDLETIKNLF